jgi:prepilin-type N-terminal cleavage/methylation domain-containing protein
MPRPAPSAPDDRGFSLIEMLVVLLVAAGLSVGVGALYRIVAEALQRRGEVVAISEALVSLHAISTALDHEPSLVTLSVPKPGHVSLLQSSTGTAGQVTLSLVDGTLAWAGLTDRDNGKLALTGFDTVHFRYLVGQDALQWRNEPLPPIRALRLDLERGIRHWETMLWMAPGGGS